MRLSILVVYAYGAELGDFGLNKRGTIDFGALGDRRLCLFEGFGGARSLQHFHLLLRKHECAQLVHFVHFAHESK